MSIAQSLHRTATVPAQSRVPPLGPRAIGPLSPTAGTTLPVLESGSISPADSGVDSAGLSVPGSPTAGPGSSSWCIAPPRSCGSGDAGAFTPISASPDAVPSPVVEVARLWVAAAAATAGGIEATPGVRMARLAYTDISLAYRQITLAITFDAVLPQCSLRTSLSKALDQFPVLLCHADRETASLAIPTWPAAPGVALVTARTDLTADQLNQLQHSYAGPCQGLSPLYEAMPPSPWKSSLLTLKATHTSDFKTVVAVAMSHVAGDVQSLAMFIQAWGELGLGGSVTAASNDRAHGDTVGMASVPNAYDPARLLVPGTVPERPQFRVVSWKIAAGTLAAIKRQAAAFVAAAGLAAAAAGSPGAGSWVSTNDVVSAIAWILQRRLHTGTDANEFSFECAFTLRGAGDVKTLGDGGVFGNCVTAAKTEPLTNCGAACADVYEAAFGIRRSISQLREGIVDHLIKARRSSSLMFQAEEERKAGSFCSPSSAPPGSLAENPEHRTEAEHEQGGPDVDEDVGDDDGGDDGVVAQALPNKRFSVTAWNSIPVSDFRFAGSNGTAVDVARFEGSTVSYSGTEAPAPCGTRMGAYILPVLGDRGARRLQLLLPARQAAEATRRFKLLLATLCGDTRDPITIPRHEL